jgi:RimJ/RimL family protein N-acetyltransferase
LTTTIRTARLLLRAATRADAGALHAILADERAMAFWSTLPHRDLEETRAWVEGMIAIPPDAGEDFVVEHEGRVIGKAGLYRFPEIGVIFHPDAWGRGLAHEALCAVLERAFHVHRLPAVEADVDPRNTGCLKLLLGLGFRETGRRSHTWLIGDRWCDSVDLRLDAKRWARRALSIDPSRQNVS